MLQSYNLFTERYTKFTICYSAVYDLLPWGELIMLLVLVLILL